MSFKLLIRTLAFLAIVFVVLYVGMNNQQPVKFSFPIAFDKSVEKPAGDIYFAIFAAGVFGGVLLAAGGGGGKRSAGKEK
jgi:uncharacterized membrane protein YciS (DUF1049 family)